MLLACKIIWKFTLFFWFCIYAKSHFVKILRSERDSRPFIPHNLVENVFEDLLLIYWQMKNGVKCFSEKEVHYFGVPTAECVERKRTTEVKPFSFEERDKQLFRKKQEAIEKVS